MRGGLAEGCEMNPVFRKSLISTLISDISKQKMGRMNRIYRIKPDRLEEPAALESFVL
jgi:hypothetical protein